MGASLVYLESPNKEKHSKEGKNDRFEYAACEMQGWRLGMEDAVIHNLEFDEDTSLFGVFDGHGGKEASYVVRENYERILKEDSNYKSGDFKKGLYDSFKETDVYLDSDKGKKEMIVVANENPEAKNPIMKILGEETKEKPASERDEESYMLDSKGCTANVVLIKGKDIYCANAGDSRCVLSRGGKAVNLSEDHKPENEIETKRIEKAGSEITEGRVDGNLNLSRSLGDLKHKRKPGLTPEEQPITCVPDIMVEKIKTGDDFIVMA